jgi:hypothetical protein
MKGRHDMHGLVIGLHVTPSAGYHAPVVSSAAIRLLAQKRPNACCQQTAYGCATEGDSMPPRKVEFPARCRAAARRTGRILVKNTMDECCGVSGTGTNERAIPTVYENFSGMGAPHAADRARRLVRRRVHRRSAPSSPHSHLNELRQINSRMYGAIVVTDGRAQRATT